MANKLSVAPWPQSCPQTPWPAPGGRPCELEVLFKAHHCGKVVRALKGHQVRRHGSPGLVHADTNQESESIGLDWSPSIYITKPSGIPAQVVHRPQSGGIGTVKS